MRKEMQQRLMARIKNITGTGTVIGASTTQLQVRGAAGKTNDRIRRMHEYGFMSRPLPGAKSYSLFLGGVTARGFTVVVEDERYQMELAPGDVAVLDDKGNLVHMTKSGLKVVACGDIDITAKKGVNITAADSVQVTAARDVSVTAGGRIIQKGETISLNDGAGVITCESVCPFIGAPHVDGSTVVTAGKS
ncbi:phage baseplate assembly protein domain-containing protein [Vibrio furnissii]|uniref:phage baseplate assembly protein domain-containing protein n=1 Tax=Vibrio furnissii TaxID=29494 RepID=UPI001EEBDA5C|nr:phage baseplate assembly protein [Vibrio furnissii]